MSRFMSRKFAGLEAYVPGEQPKDRSYIKLNTNESPYEPTERVSRAVEEASHALQLYSDPECRALTELTAKTLGVKPEQVLMTNGSDEILNFAFMTYGDADHPFVFPNVTYGFYPIFAKVNNVPYRTIPLLEDFTVNVADYENIGANIIIANPNAPTGLFMSVDDIERIVRSNPDHIVVVDEAYVDFGTETCVPLIDRYDNLLVTRTFSKSYSLAGARLGIGIGSKALIADLVTIKYSTNPFNVNRMTIDAGIAALEDNDIYMARCREIVATREYTKARLEALGFTATASKTNFLFAMHPALDGKALYLRLKDMGILIRHFDAEVICQYNRITVGTRDEMDALLRAIETIMKEDGLL